MDKKDFYEFSALGLIAGINKLQEIFGRNYSFPQVSFFAMEEGIFPPEESHFVMKNVNIFFDENSIKFTNDSKELSFSIKNANDRKYFFGNKWGQRKVGNINCDYIEYTLDDYYVVIFVETLAQA